MTLVSAMCGKEDIGVYFSLHVHPLLRAVNVSMEEHRQMVNG